MAHQLHCFCLKHFEQKNVCKIQRCVFAFHCFLCFSICGTLFDHHLWLIFKSTLNKFYCGCSRIPSQSSFPQPATDKATSHKTIPGNPFLEMAHLLTTQTHTIRRGGLEICPTNFTSN